MKIGMDSQAVRQISHLLHTKQDMTFMKANSADPDEMPQLAASHLGLQNFQVPHL